MLLVALALGPFLTGGCAAPVAESAGVAATCDSVASGVVPAGAAGAGLTRPAALIGPVRRADDFVNSIGINLHLSYFRTPYGTGWASIVKPRLLALGVRHVRDGGSVVPDDHWMQLVYGRMGELADQGIHFDLIISPAQGTQDYSIVHQFDRLVQYAGPAVEAFEGLNEHDLSGRPDWVREVRECQAALYRAVKNDPRTAGLPVYGPSMGHAANAAAVGDLSRYMDYGAIHPYPGGKPPLTNLPDHETRTAVINGSHALVASETGYHTAMQWTGGHPPVSEAAMARYVPRIFLEYFDAGIQRTYLYELIDEGSDPADREMSFGLLRSDGSEKPAYAALRNLITILRDPGPPFAPGPFDYTLAGDTTGVRSLVLARRDGRFDLILWQDAMSYDVDRRVETVAADRTVTLQLPAERTVLLYRPVTSATPLGAATRGTSITLLVPDGPLIVEIGP
jgi:hypothetical protein